MFHEVKIFNSTGNLKKVITPKQLLNRDNQILGVGLKETNIKGLGRVRGVRKVPRRYPCAREGCNNIGQTWSTSRGKYCGRKCGDAVRKGTAKAKTKI